MDRIHTTDTVLVGMRTPCTGYSNTAKVLSQRTCTIVGPTPSALVSCGCGGFVARTPTGGGIVNTRKNMSLRLTNVTRPDTMQAFNSMICIDCEYLHGIRHTGVGMVSFSDYNRAFVVGSDSPV
jgi:hypothetical protein